MPPPTRRNDNDYHFHAYDFGGAAPWVPGPGQPARHGWSFYSMVQDLQGLQAYGAGTVPNIALNNIGAPTLGGRNTMELSFGNNAAHLPSIVITGGIHSREWIATEFTYLLAEYLIRNYVRPPVTAYGQAIRSIVNSRMIRVIPMLNPDGNMLTVYGNNRYWRKNLKNMPTVPPSFGPDVAPGGAPNAPFQNFQTPPGAPETYDVPDYDPVNQIPPNPANFRPWPLAAAAGIDLNRNNDTPGWGYECAPPPHTMNALPSSDAYFGPNRASEIETGNLDLALAAAAANPPGIAASIDYHAYGRMIVYSGEADANGAVDPNYLYLGNIMQQLIVAQGQPPPDYQLGPPFAMVGYNATGTVIDRAAQQYQSRAFTIELDPGPGAGLPGFDLPETQIRTVFEKNIRGALALVAAPINALGAPGVQLARLQLAVNHLQFFMWNVYGRGNRLP